MKRKNFKRYDSTPLGLGHRLWLVTNIYQKTRSVKVDHDEGRI